MSRSSALDSVRHRLAAVGEPDANLIGHEAAFRAEVGWRLRALRAWDGGLSQDELAARAGVTRNFVSAVERGAQGVDAWRLWRLANALGVSLGLLLCQEPLILGHRRPS